MTAMLPKGARIVSTAVAEDRIAVTLDVNGAIEIHTFDLRSLKPAGRLRFATEPKLALNRGYAGRVKESTQSVCRLGRTLFPITVSRMNEAIAPRRRLRRCRVHRTSPLSNYRRPRAISCAWSCAAPCSNSSRSASTASGSRPTCAGICGRTPRSSGDAPEYTGTAKELLIGFLFALAILVPIYLAYFFIGIEAERYQAFASIPLVLFFYLFFQFAILSRAPLPDHAHDLARRAILDDGIGLGLCVARRLWMLAGRSSRSGWRCRGGRRRSNATRCATPSTAILPAASTARLASCSSGWWLWLP